MGTFPLESRLRGMMNKMVVWQRVWRLWTNEDGGEWGQDWKWKDWIFWHISLLKHKHISRLSWNTNAPKEYFDSHPSTLERHRMPKASNPKANLWPDFSDKGFQFMKKFMGTLLEIFKWGGMGGARIRGWLWLAGNIYGQIADRILPGRYSLTANACQPGEQHNILHTCVCFCSLDPSNAGRYRRGVQFLGCLCASVCAVGCALCTVVHRLIVWKWKGGEAEIKKDPQGGHGKILF